MKLFTRIVFGINSIYQLGIGLLALLVPRMIIDLYGSTPADVAPMERGIMRLLGVCIVFFGILSVLITRDPDEHPILLKLMGVLAGLTIVGTILVVGMGESTFRHLGTDTLMEVLMISAAVLHPRRAGQAGRALAVPA